MKQQVFKLLVLFILALAMVNCQKEDDSFEEPKQELIFKKVYFDELNQNNKLAQKLETLKENKSLYAREDNDSLLDFTINNEVANYVEYENGNHSYSFSINRPYQTNTVENLLLVSNSNNDYNAFIVDYNISKEEYENLENTSNLTRTINYFPIEYDNINLRTEVEDACTWDVHTWVWMDGSVDVIITITCNSGGSSTSGDTSSDGPGNDNPSNDGSGGNGVNFNNPGGYSAPVKTRNYTQEITDCLGNLNFDTQLWLQDSENFFNMRNLSMFLETNGCSETTQNIGDSLLANMMEDDTLTFLEALEQYFDENPEVFMEMFQYDGGNEDYPIEDMAVYLDCFNDGKVADNYKFILYVDQPVKGSDAVANAITMSVGHTFFSLIKNNTDGTNVTKTLGFYPSGSEYLNNSDLDGPGIFQDNGIENDEHDYDVSVTFNDLTNSQFNNIINDLIIIENSNYDLNDYNCTTVGHDLAVDNLGFTLEPNLSFYKWFVILTPVVGISPGQYGQDLFSENHTANVPSYTTIINNDGDKPKTSTSNCN
ncbi:hypothetical protein Q4512_01910 [Oceanihabitans sp. 2_MG-2023]|uniref:hypothetical protein n=1 Tax=Oceanihabitans sp. 2_MG-2023 TaxID=3062661 RepID=UPI0026E48635|nr:hypothetical protein [Oceanihabitans sp. 2_MG-2023]MDO6595649.1 hypothetical protein [Oceanihabitans sp. 2_MG-2023]